MPYSDPKYPIVNPSPTVDSCVESMRIRDYSVLVGIPAASWGYGYIVGRPLRMATASTAAAIGFTFATFVVMQDTRGRLMGYKENGKEISKFGLHPEQPLKHPHEDRRFPTATDMSSPVVSPPLNWKNYN